MIWKIIVTLAIGALSGWIASAIMGSRSGLGRDMLLGLIGSVVGGLVAGFFGIYAGSWIGSIVISVAGACLMIFIARIFSHRNVKDKS
jgi:uncharacterized membrane protein YeaQ/YmgE (transglycosylase-associated protein family)